MSRRTSNTRRGRSRVQHAEEQPAEQSLRWAVAASFDVLEPHLQSESSGPPIDWRRQPGVGEETR